MRIFYGLGIVSIHTVLKPVCEVTDTRYRRPGSRYPEGASAALAVQVYVRLLPEARLP